MTGSDKGSFFILDNKNPSTSPWQKRDVASTDINYAPLEIEGRDIGVVYFVGDVDGKKIKIGYTRNPKKDLGRTKQHKGVWSEKEPQLLAAIRGSWDNEQFILSYFKLHLVNGQKETVWAEPVFLPYLIWLRDQYFVSTSLEEYYTAHGQLAMDNSCWLPDESRVSTRRTEPSLYEVFDPWAFLPDREVTGDDWYTPPEIMEIARQVLGTIDLDPASHVLAQSVVKATRFFTKAQEGLTLPWEGRIWLNPPFGDWDLWLKKALLEISKGHVHSIIFLGFTRTLSAHYFSDLLKVVNAICIKKGRIAFWGHKSKSETPPDGPVFLYWGPHVQKFSTIMSSIGTVLIRVTEE